MLVNQAYTALQGYSYIEISPQSSAQLPLDYPHYSDWNKVRTLQDALDRAIAAEGGAQYVAVIDMDTIAINMDFSILELALKFPEADVLFGGNDPSTLALDVSIVIIRLSEFR
jgi:hypothetical protein